MSQAQRERAAALEQASDELVATHPELPLAKGRQIFAAQCASCHQPDGQGVKNAIPPLAGHLPLLLRADRGRQYVASLVLYGATGEVTVLGRTYRNQMPSLGALLKDADVAAALAWASLSWGNDKLLGDAALVSQDEVAAIRRKPVKSQDTLRLRPAL